MKFWIDDIRPAPEGYIWCKSVRESKNKICEALSNFREAYENGEDCEKFYIEEINLDHDAGDYSADGGDYIELLNWLEWLGGDVKNWNYHIHSMNPVGVQNMRAIIRKNGWKEI